MIKVAENTSSLKSLKFKNRKLVLSYMRGTGAVSVNEISHATGLSKMTVHKIIDYYLEEGMISHAGKGVSTEEGGKKPNLFVFNAHCRYIYAVRLAGDYLSTAIVNLKGEIVVGKKTVTLNDVSVEEMLRLIGKAFHEQIEEKKLPCEQCLAAIVGANGIVDTEQGVCLVAYQNQHWGRNIDIRSGLSQYIPSSIPVHVESWWRHLAHGEIHFGKNESRKRFFLIGNSGDYISGGLVHHGQVCQGQTGFAGEIGHLIVSPESTVKCVCGGCGCLESLVSPSNLISLARDLRNRFPDSSLFANDRVPAVADLGHAADNGDDLARAVLQEAVRHFAIAVNNIVHICDPGRIVFFGDFCTLGQFFLNSLQDRVHNLNLSGVDKRTIIEYSSLSDEHSIVGAANHMTDRMFSGGR